MAGASRDDDRFWKGTSSTSTATTPAIMVSSRFGVGYTVSFGNLAAWLVCGPVVAVAAGLAAPGTVAGR